jgi:hypothetical protein
MRCVSEVSEMEEERGFEVKEGKIFGEKLVCKMSLPILKYIALNAVSFTALC